MKYIEHISELKFDGALSADGDLQVEKLFDGPFRTLLHIRMRAGATLTKHKAAEHITVLCLAGEGVFRAGADLEDSQQMTQGTLITLGPEIEHEAEAVGGLQLLVTKFKSS
ncbi:MAG: hypothetical protein H0V76_02795 [Blastocatellia bacterium]|nr:hypothetical protein [Blastocatellia bacterium]